MYKVEVWGTYRSAEEDIWYLRVVFLRALNVPVSRNVWWNQSDWILVFCAKTSGPHHVISISYHKEPLPHSLHTQALRFYLPNTDFSTQARSGKPILNPSMDILKTNTCYSFHITHSSVNFTWFCTFQPSKIWWQTSVQAWSTVWFFSILNSLKTNTFLV